MKKVEKKKIIILIILIILAIVEIIAFQDSRAQKSIEVKVAVIEKDSNLESETITLEAYDSGENGYYIILPETINEKVIKNYEIESKEIIKTSNSETNEIVENVLENSTNTLSNISTIQEETVQKIVNKVAGDKLYLTKEEAEKKETTIKVTYNTIQKDNQNLYEKKISETQESQEIEIKGYMPKDAQIKITKINEEDIKQTAQSYINENVVLKVAYDIKIISNEKEYEPTDFDEKVQVSIKGIEKIEQQKQKYKIIHIDDNNEIKEIENIETKDNEVIFKAESFSVYALLLDSTESVVAYVDTSSTLENTADIWDGTIATGIEDGDGSQSNPYLIASGAELAYLAEQVNDYNSFENKYFQLTKDIDLDAREWTPIGDTYNSFRGIFDGAGHIIANAQITISTLPTGEVLSYGIFGSIGGGSSNSIIRNVELSDINVVLTASGRTSYWSDQKGYHVGTLVGSIYKNGKVINVIVKNSSISDTATVTLRNSSFEASFGGLAGYTSNTSDDTSDPGSQSRYVIENCFVNTNIDIDISSNRSYAGQFHCGGIIGTIISQAVWPSNCLYVGTINANGFIGPMFGALRQNTSYTSTGNFVTLWNGNDAGNLTLNNGYYNSYLANNVSFANTIQSGVSTYRVNNSSSNIGYVQGVNKGIYTNDVASLLTMFNNYVGSNYVSWTYENNTFSFIPRLEASVSKNGSNYSIIITDPYNVGNYTYKWYRDGVLDTNTTGNTITVVQNTTNEYHIKSIISDGTYYTVVNFVVPRLEIHIEFSISESTNSVTAVLAGTALPYINLSDYTYKWYKLDISGMETEEITGVTGNKLSNIEKTNDYKVVATNNVNSPLSAEKTFTYGNRTVIFVNYSSGNNNNDGFTPDTPVKTMPTAYSKLSSSGTRESNVIVIIGNYSNDDYIHNLTSTNRQNYSKNATLTGCYKGEDYSARLYFAGNPDDNSGSGGRFLYADTTLQYMTLYASTSSSGTGRTYMYCQGHSLTIGEQVRQERYATTSNTNALVDGAAAPDFHLLGGFSNLNTTTLESNNGTMLIKSGCFARVIAGSRNTKVNSTSKNTTGQANNPFNMKIIADIKNSTRGNITYDINLLVSGQTDGNIYGNMEIDIKNGKVGKITGGSIGYSRSMDNYPSNSYFGSSKLNVEGGTIDEMFGGSLGRLQSDVYYYGAIEINISGGTINNTVYGVGAGGVTGYNVSSTDPYKSYGAGYNTSVTINISGGTINGNVYGAGYGYSSYLSNTQIATDGGTLYGDSHINITGGTITGNVYGAGRGYSGYSGKTALAQMKGNSNIAISGTPSITGEIYGAGEGVPGYIENAKLIGNSNININTNLNINIYGGGNIAKVEGTTSIYMNSGNSTKEIYGGGNVGEVQGTTKVYIKGGQAKEIYGGGKSSNSNNTEVYLQGGQVDNIHGGANVLGAIEGTYIQTTSGTVGTIYGGNNVGGSTGTTNIQINGGNITKAIYGGGEQIAIETANITLNSSSSTIPNVYGGGYNAGATVTNINCKGANATNIFGGSNINGYIPNTIIIIENGNIENVFGGNNEGGTVQTTNISVTGGTTQTIYGGGNKAECTSSNIEITGGNITSIYGGGNEAGLTTSNIELTTGTIQAVYGGSNKSGNVQETNIETTESQNNVNIETIYGGNNQGGITTTSNITLNGGSITNVYGGGNEAVTNETNVYIYNEIETNVYGGGNKAEVTTDTNVHVENATVGDNVYGGGNEGLVRGNTNVHIKNSELLNNVYAGGNGITASVYGNTNLVMEGTTNKITNSVFGGGNKAITGDETDKDSTSNVNIVGGKIGKNVYGGANTSVIYGETQINIGYDVVNNNSLEIGNIEIAGTVFGGGEANESGSEVYDFSFISVTNGIHININANNHDNFYIKGSIFGSGNASSTSGQSYINIKDYGSTLNPQNNVSIQRANVVTLNNSNITLSGATDRTNEYSSIYFTFSRIDELKLKNNSTVYLNYGANLLKKVSSILDENGVETKAQVTINEETGATEKNVDNRIFMAEGKNLNIATNEQVTAYGEVYGMIFLGLYTNTMNPSTSTGFYNHSYENGDTITNAGTFSSNSYAIAQHTPNHDIKSDGFYSNYNENGIIKKKYIEVTPQDDVYYIWLVGEKMNVTSFEISLTASKYATLGTYELLLTGFSDANIKFSISGFSAGLSSEISLIDPMNIEPIAQEQETANNVYGLTMKSGNNGWKSKGKTTFLTANGGTYTGNNEYDTDNSTYTPTLNFCLYHSENISREGRLGDVKVRLQAMIPIDDLNYEISYIDINATLLTALYQDDFYEASITPGQEFGLFTTTETNVTKNSAFSTYYSLYIGDFSNSKYYENYRNYDRVLVSRNSNNQPYVFLENTKLTMLDMVTNEYYYYVVTAQDVANNKSAYKLSEFTAMGSTNKQFNEDEACDDYYDINKDLIYENFIFHIHFAESNINTNLIDNTLLLELRDSEQQILIGVLGIQRDSMKYSVYNDKDSIIQITANTPEETVYLGSDINLNVNTEFQQNIVSSKTIYDTQYFDQKMGIKITIFDNNGNQVRGDSLLGIEFLLDGKKYYPRIDGTTRIKIADKVSNVLSRITMITKNNKVLATGDYIIRIESFGSSDGIYYGIESSDSTQLEMTIINSSFGLKVITDDKSKIISKDTGATANNNNSLVSQIQYSSGLNNPRIAVSLYRRNYDTVYAQSYSLVELEDYVTNELNRTAREKEYVVTDNPTSNSTFFLNMKENLITGTYKLVFKLYDGNTYIGEDFEYVIIE